MTERHNDESFDVLGAASDIDLTIHLEMDQSPDLDICNWKTHFLQDPQQSGNSGWSSLSGLAPPQQDGPASTEALSQLHECDNTVPLSYVGNHQPTELSRLSDMEPSSSKQLRNTDVTPLPKIGKRFSSNSVRVLKAWFCNHAQRPYPTIGDVEILERQTGLSKQQIANWFANARRRMKFRPQETTTTSSPSLDIPRRCDSPAPFETMNPLQRWQNSPPEHEPASVSAIARAMSAIPADSNGSNHTFALDISLLNDFSASSAGTSHSSRSSVSFAHSQTSESSPLPVNHLKKATKRRRRRGGCNRPKGKGAYSLSQAFHPFQCTFCTETFKSKHNWERHEKSLHLSLEQWECSPCGPTMANDNSEMVCVYCGQLNPDQDHLNNHDYAACQERQLEDRTFYRKDHLRQHLKLVHNANFMKWPMEQWRCESRDIRSRCGFCGIFLSTWADRVNHLAEHFKNGKTIADWQGGWGFEAPVLAMVENSMPPYLIHYERNSPWPFTTQQGPPETPTSAFELLQLELEYFVANYVNAEHRRPSNEELQYEACCIIFGSDMLSRDPTTPAPSWLRDVLMSSEEITRKARIRPMKSAAKSRITHLIIHGKDSIFEACNMEAQLREYADTLKMLDLGVGDDELQREACSITRCMEAMSPNPSETFVNLLTGLIEGSTYWLAPFRRRADLVPVDSPSAQHCPATMLNIGSSIPSDGASCREPTSMASVNLSDAAASGSAIGSDAGHWMETTVPFFLNDDNCYRRLARELSRFVASTMSVRNPNSHVPTDEEMQHQARWIMFDDDDPWNQTPADNADWLREFKRDIGLLQDNASSDPEGGHTNGYEEMDNSIGFSVDWPWM